MTIVLSILAWILNPFYFIVNIFSNRNTKNNKETKVTRSKLCTPPRVQPRLSRRDFRDENVRGRRFHSSPNLPSRLPKSFPRIRNPSEICLLGSNRATPFRPNDVSRTRRPNTNLHGRVNGTFDPRYPTTAGRDVAQEDLLIVDVPDSYVDRSSGAKFGYDPEVEDHHLYYVRGDGTLDFGKPLRKTNLSCDLHSAQGAATTTSHMKTAEMRGRKLNDARECFSVLPNYYTPKKTSSQVSLLGSNANKFTPLRAKRIAANLLSGDIKRRRENLDFRTVVVNKGSKTSLDFNPPSKDQILNDSSDGCDDLSRRYLQLKNNTRSTPGYFHQKIASSRIPIRSCSRSRNSKSEELTSVPQRYRNLSTARRNLLDGFQENKDSADPGSTKPNDFGNWITFRNDISVKFERMFKSLTKKKHQSTGNIIDSFLHIQWLQLAKLTVDKDGAMFRNFAGGKVVLTFGEYKYLIHKICTANELDYWEVMRKMATFGEDEF